MSVCVVAEGPSRGAVPVHRADRRIQPLERFEHPADAADLVLNRDQVDLFAGYVGDCSSARHTGQIERTDDRGPKL